MIKRLLALVVLGAFLSVGLVLQQSTQASAVGAAGECAGSFTEDRCVVLIVTLDGISSPSSDVTVSAERSKSSDYQDNSITLYSATTSEPACEGAGYKTMVCSSKLASNQYTSLYGIDGVGQKDTCLSTSSDDIARNTFNITVTQSGKTIGTKSNVYLCNDLDNESGVSWYHSETVSVTPAGSTSSKGGIKGKTSYKDDLTGDTGKCATSSRIYISDGPDKLSGGDVIQVPVDGSSNYKTDLELTPGSGYTVEINCNESADISGNVYSSEKGSVTVKANEWVVVDFNGVRMTTAGGGDDSTVPAATEDKDETSCAIDGIGWLICPVVRFVSRITDASYTVVSAMLSVQPLSTNAGSDTYKAWEVMRNIANICFVIAFLIIIYSQITGAGVSNYGIKKMLPKIVIAAILVNVSYWICAIAVDLSNILGTAIKDLIDGLNAGLINEDAQSGNGVWSKLAAIVLVAGVALLVGLSAFLPMVILAVMAIVTVLLVLTLRQGLIILLIVIAPLAFVAYLLPNTEQWFKKWMGLFQILLLMFPIISLIFAASSLAGTIIGNSANDVENEGIKIALQSMAAGVTIIPLFITPIVLKAAGGILGKVGAFVNNPNRGPFDRMRKGAEGYRGRRKNLMQARRVGRANSTLSSKEGGVLGGAYSRRRKVAGWIRGSGASRAVNAAEKDKYAEIGANAAKRDYVADRALGDDSYATKIGGAGNERDIIAYAQQAKKDELAKDIQAAAATMAGYSNDQVAEMTKTKINHLDGGRKLTEAEYAAAAYRIMETGSFNERKDTLEYIASNKTELSTDVRGEIVKRSIGRGDNNIFGPDFGNQIVRTDGSINSKASLAQAAATNAETKLSAEHLVQNGASTKYLIDSAQGNAAALASIKNAADAARVQANTASKVTAEFDEQFERVGSIKS